MQILKLSQLTRDFRNAAGGKGAQLGEAIQKGVPVPPGFVISSDTWSKLSREQGIESYAQKVLAGIDFENPIQLEEVALSLRERVLCLEIPTALREDILAAFRDLGARQVAVRSSAPEEDAESSSWAGQFDTLLGVTETNLFEAIRSCWASLFGVRALQYRKLQKQHDQELAIAIVVQEMVASDFAGVAFSLNPVSGNAEEILLEGVQGLGESLVSGEVTPNRWRFKKVTHGESPLIEYQTAEQQRGLFLLSEGGSAWRELDCNRAEVPSTEIMQKLVYHITAIEHSFGHPVDVEWAISQNRVFVTQVRPITATGSALSDDLNQYEFAWGERHSVITAENWLESYLRYRHLPANECQHGFSFSHLGHLTTYFYRGDLEAAHKEGGKLCEEKEFQAYLQNSLEIRKKFQQLYAEVKACDRKKLSNEDLLRFYTRYQDCFDTVYALYKISQPEYTGNPAERLKVLLAQFESNAQLLEEVFIQATAVTDMDIVKEEEIASLRLSLGRDLSREAMLAHGAKFPWLFNNTFDRVFVESFLCDKFRDLQAQPIIEREEHINRLEREVQHAREEKRAVLARYDCAEISYLSEMLSQLAVDRYRLKAWWAGAEYLFLELFEEIAERAGETVEEFLFTYRIEDISKFLREGIRVSETVKAARNDAYAIHLEGGKCTWYEGQEAHEIFGKLVGYHDHSASEALLSGTIANTGRARGFARIIHVEGLKRLLLDMERFQPGEILVTTMTQPTMLSLARKAAAIVTNEGGVTSHASVIARELRIPCIVGTKTGTLQIQDGDYIEVDAYRGVVFKVREGEV